MRCWIVFRSQLIGKSVDAGQETGGRLAVNWVLAGAGKGFTREKCERRVAPWGATSGLVFHAQRCYAG